MDFIPILGKLGSRFREECSLEQEMAIIFKLLRTGMPVRR